MDSGNVETGPLHEMGIFPVTDTEVHQCVAYLCNLSYSDVLDPCKNAKFPGGLAVSLSRNILNLLQGQNAVHKSYEPTDILAWISPVERSRVIPPMLIGLGGQQLKDEDVRVSRGIRHHPPQLATLAVDFGDDRGLFEPLPVFCMLPGHIDFGGSDGLFVICEL